MIIKDPKSPVTNQTLNEAVDAILKGMESLSTKEDITRLEGQIEEAKTDIVFIKRNITDIKAAAATTVELKDFNRLKGRIEKIEGHLQFA